MSYVFFMSLNIPKLPEPKRKKPKRTDTPVFSARVEPDVKLAFDKWARKHGLTKKQATEYALKLAMQLQP
jgi:hypothetical protein